VALDEQGKKLLSKKMGTSQARIVALENAENTTLDSLFSKLLTP